MSKVEIDELGDGVGHRDVNLTTALRSLKGRVLRLHKDAAKALYGDGPYRLDKAYTNFAVTYDEWQDLLPGERKALLRRFFTEVCRPVVTNEGKQKESSPQVAKVTPSTPETQSFRRLSVAVEEFGIPSEVVPATTLRDMFRNAEALLNEPGAIMPAASDDPRMRTVKSRHGKAPLIVKPVKAGHQLDCPCSVVGICQDTIAVAEDLECLQEYLEEIKRKFQRRKGPSVNLAAAYNSRRTPKEQGIKPNEIQKAFRRKRNDTSQSWVLTTSSAMSSQSVNSTTMQDTPSSMHQQQQPYCNLPQQYCGQENSSAVVLQEQPIYTALTTTQQHPSFPPVSATFYQTQQPQFSSFPSKAIPQQQQVPASFAQPFKVPMSTNFSQQSQQLSSASLLAPQQAWHSGWSPYQYEVCLLPNSAKKCYGCNQDFADKYRQEPHNVVIRHTDRRIRGKDLDGNIQFNSDFTHTYYRCNIGHITRKNPFFNGKVCCSAQLKLTPEQESVIINAGMYIEHF